MRYITYEEYRSRNRWSDHRKNILLHFTISDIEMFLTKINRGDGCWIYQTTAKRYPKFKGYLCHRVSYEMFVGPIPENMVIDHLCGIHHCVKPGHLEPVTSSENASRYNRSLKVGV